jgi:hypothetical protein
VLNQCEAVINPAGVWHTADVDHQAAVLIVTAGLGTKNRLVEGPRRVSQMAGTV